MKHAILHISFVSVLIVGLSACGGSGSSSNGVSEFNGLWKGACEANNNTRSFKQNWTINGNSLTNDLQVWLTSVSCQSTNPTPVKVITSIDYKNSVDVAAICINGKAQEVDMTYLSLTSGNATITGEKNIKDFLASRGVDILPKFTLICKSTDGKLYRGLLTASKDGSTAAKRPTEMDTTTPLVP